MRPAQRKFFVALDISRGTSLCEITGWEKTPRRKRPYYRSVRLAVLTRTERQRLDELIDACKPTGKVSCKLGFCAWKYPDLCSPKTKESARDVERFIVAVEDRIAGQREMWIYFGRVPRYWVEGNKEQAWIMDNKTGRKVRGSVVSVAGTDVSRFNAIKSQLEAQATRMNWEAERRQ